MAHVMVVEDEPITAADLEQKLIALGHSVTWLDNGEEALARARPDAPDLVLMDIRLKGELSGIDAARQLRETSDVPVVFLTAFADRETVDKACDTEPYGYLIKPFTDRSLASAVQVALTRANVERKHMERERWLAAALRSTGQAVIAVARDASVRFMNAHAEALLGVRAADVLGNDARTVVRFAEAGPHPLDRALFDDQLTSAAAQLLSNANEPVSVHCSAAPVRSADGAIAGAVLVFRALPATQESEPRPRTWDKLGAWLTHEINNPLTFTLGGLNLAIGELDELLAVDALRAEQSDPSEVASVAPLRRVAELLRDAQVGAVRIADVVRELNSFSHGSAERAQVRLGELIDMAFGLSGIDPAAAVRLVRRFGSAPVVRGNKLQLAAAIAQCMRSAVDVIARRGVPAIVLEIDVGTAGRGWAELRICARANTAEAKGAKAAPIAGADDAGPTSLGATLAEQVVENHAGELMSSLHGDEPTLTLRFPPMTSSAGSAPLAARDHRADADRGSVLLVDDEPTIRRVLEIALRPSHDVTTAASAPEALALLARGDGFDAIVCDLTMPGMGGRALYERLRETQPELADRLLFMTGGALNTADAQFLSSMAGRYLTKPFSPDDLAALISARMRKRSEPRASSTE